jgi:hypothetical protein
LTYVLIGKIFRHIAGIERIVVPTQEFTSEKDKKSKAVSCSVKAQEGLLYPLKQSVIFV